MSTAQTDFTRALKTEAKSLSDAARKYRTRRKRHPPPGFSAWYAFAVQHGAVVVESFWDQIYDDLAPFWGIDPPVLRMKAAAVGPRVEVRDGVVRLDAKGKNDRLRLWENMLGALAREKHVLLPDVDVPFNSNAEPGLVVPWETIDTALELARPILAAPMDVLTQFSSYDSDQQIANYTFDPEWLGARLTHPTSSRGPRPYWSLVRPACHPRSWTRKTSLFVDIWHPQGHTSSAHSAANMLPTTFPNGSEAFGGFVGNWSRAGDVCALPELQGLHGGFVGPESMSASVKFFPWFGAVKFSVGNDVLIPGGSAWNESLYSLGTGEEEEGVRVAWEEKQDVLFWRGPATGGHNTALNWQRFHRHRFVSMMNASHVAFAEASLRTPVNGEPENAGVGPAGTFRLLAQNPYHLPEQTNGTLAEWIHSWADVAFTDLHCDELSPSDHCPYNSDFFSVTAPPAPREQEKYKYTAILDGNGSDNDSEFINALRREVVPLRASVYRHWFDGRLWPWVHFVPLDNTFVDVYAIGRFFRGRHRDDSHDNQARRIALAGKEWAEKVLRKEDMLIYLYRLLLEYARVVDDKRERLGWVGDLVGEGD
ncbi:uncharacterized protein BDR25DRAFT_376394 [Lindgomyces ingoldianus]|uniref:Uncharacterized protein n=1 Tax=Lindgomyces ingoldianus TaxID=673940 RepID=A0ACB6QJW5_9PLEO|nr:uncharacterized protein BDR25DRAFT_376394 [Lindgomyces ingoldianus]KAF2466868.1 hypothetical protein BDR25DRAFT_376394 [Lindgomyces ingoldianus]